MKTLASLRDSDLASIGPKAAELSRLARAGFPVPETAVLDAADFARFDRGVPPPDLAALISRCVGAFRARGYANLAIRFSPRRADAPPIPAVLGIPTGDFAAVLAAIRGASSKGAALLLQAQIPAELSGRLTTIDRETGGDTVHLIESGGERVAYDWATETETGTSPLKSDQIRALSKAALDVQREFGVPFAFEWRIAGGKTYFLKAKALPRLFDAEKAWSSADPRTGGVFSTNDAPLFSTHARAALARALSAYFNRLGLAAAPAATWTTAPAGRIHWNVEAAKRALKSLPGFVERDFDANLGQVATYPGDGATTTLSPKNFFGGLRKLARAKHSLQGRAARSDAVVKHAEAIAAELGPARLRALSDGDLAARAARFVDADWGATELESYAHAFDLWTARILATRKREKYADTIATLAAQQASLRAAALRMGELARQIFLELGRRCALRKHLAAADDLLFLDASDALALFRGENAPLLQARLEKGRTAVMAYRNHREPRPARAPARNAPVPTGGNRITPVR